MIEGSNSRNKPWNRNNHSNKRKFVGKWFENKKPRIEEVRREFPVCATCGKHSGECYRKTGACYNCGKTEHLIRDCPEARKGDTRTHGRVYAMTRDQAVDDPNVVTGTLSVSDQEAYVLFDSGSTHTFVSSKFAKTLSVKSEKLDFELCVSTPADNLMCACDVLRSCKVFIEGQDCFC